MIRRAQPWLGTLVDICINDPLPEQDAHAAAALAFAEVALVHALMSFHDPASDVARLNRAPAGARVAVHAHTWAVLALAQEVAAASRGIFNIACAAQLVAWDCLPAPGGAAPRYAPRVPVLRVAEAGAVRKLAEGWIDLGGIAKGYAVDLAVAALARAGVRSACVNAGGDLRVLGAAAFPVTLRAPGDPAAGAAQLQLSDAALATSASYFSARGKDGARVSALVDGRDGRPMTGAASATVQAPTCAVADALTKIVLASGDARHPALAVFGAAALII
ncbi:FAD:protein FMN transferase [Janthinobacterium sp.]|uniref:FAD:protein FMN transferase n=1 Tax=Janthinobacterium sp. TaxID=1871054 RepID=UPI00293D87CB|nr:FAD:protein FMN transferase [Janthinobacterium sp.]